MEFIYLELLSLGLIIFVIEIDTFILRVCQMLKLMFSNEKILEHKTS